MTEPVNKCVVSYSCTAHIWQYCKYFQEDDRNACKHFDTGRCLSKDAREELLETKIRIGEKR
jgi:hypothetical protein